MNETMQVIFQPDGKRGRVAYGLTVLEAARLLGVDLTSLCGGQTTCGKCKIVLKSGAGNVNLPTDQEKNLLSENELREGYRLACVAKVKGELIIVVPDESRKGSQRLQFEGAETPVTLEPSLTKVVLRLPESSLEDLRSDLDRLLDTFQSKHDLSGIRVRYDVMRNVPTVIREGDWTVTVTAWNEQEIIDVEPGVDLESYGFAVDVGTTKIAGYLMDLNTGKLVGLDSLMNPQIPYGEDVISRINYSTEHEALKELHEALIQGVNQTLKNACRKAGVSPEKVYEMTVVGNTAMHHFFLNIYPKFLALYPYTPVLQSSLNVEASGIGVEINPCGNIHVLPVIAGFVGADCVADILATEIYKSDTLCFLIDIGTNTEVVIGSEKGLVACSCASGPAFEGAHIKHGMRAATGAIEKVWIDPDTFEPVCQVIDDETPRGICGSGIVDIVAEMLKNGLMDSTGSILSIPDNRRIRLGQDGSEFVIVCGGETAGGKDIVITQSDVREIQKAKAAMYSGASILMRELEITQEYIKQVFVAGAFGTYIDSANARTIGMFPDFQLESVRRVGNAAGTGARMALLSRKVRQLAGEITRMVKYVELAADPEFESEYMNALYFPHLDLGRFPETVRILKSGRFQLAPRHMALQGSRGLKRKTFVQKSADKRSVEECGLGTLRRPGS